MKEKVELQKAREFGDILSDTFLFIRQNFGPLMRAYITICGFFLVAGTAVEIVARLRDIEDETAGTPLNASYWITLLFSVINGTVVLLTTLSYISLYRDKGKQAPSVAEVWGYFRYFFFRVFFTNILTTLLVILGFILCIIPGIYFAPIMGLVAPIMIMENASLSYSFNHSFKLIKENWWFVFGTLLIIIIIYFAANALVILPALIITGGAQWISGMKFNSTEIIARAISTNLCHIFYIVPCIAVTLIYFSLSDQKHGTSLINRIQMLGKRPMGGDNSTEQY